MKKKYDAELALKGDCDVIGTRKQQDIQEDTMLQPTADSDLPEPRPLQE